MSTNEALTSAQMEAFDEQGYLVIPDVFSLEEVREMASAFDGLVRRAKRVSETTVMEGSQFVVDGEAIKRVVWCGACEPVLCRYGRDARLTQMAAQLLETDTLEQLINQAHFKFPGDGVVFRWHQDSEHRRYGTELWEDVGVRGSFVETATAIDPMTEDNGPLQFIPGSHRRGHIGVDPDTGELPVAAYDPSRAVTITMEPGSVALFGPYTIHSSAENRSTTPRRLFLNGFAHPGANSREYPGEGANRRVRFDGELVCGQAARGPQKSAPH